MANTTACTRCGVPLQVAPTHRPHARPLRRTTTPHGVCASCAVTIFLRTTEPLASTIAQSPHGPAMLLAPHVIEHFAAILRTGHADAAPEEIDWQRVVSQWDLPLPGAARRRTREGSR